MVHDEVEDDPDAAGPRGPDQLDEVTQVAQPRVDAEEVGDVVAVVDVTRRVERHQPQAGDAEVGEVVDPARHARQVALPVAVGSRGRSGRRRSRRPRSSTTGRPSWTSARTLVLPQGPGQGQGFGAADRYGPFAAARGREPAGWRTDDTAGPGRPRRRRPRIARMPCTPLDPLEGGTMSRLVVVTGASAGVGRATARELRRRGDRVALLARGDDGPGGGGRGGRGGRRHRAAASRVDVADPDAGRRRRRAGRGPSSAPIDVWVNDAFTSVFAPFVEIDAGGVPPGHRGHLPRLRLRHHGRAAPDAAARPRRDRAGRLGAGLPRHPAAERVLRRQARDPGLPRVAALRAAARPEQRARHDGAAAGGQHAAVRLGAVPAAPPGPAGAADLPARGRRPRGASTPPTTRSRREYWVGGSTVGDPGRQRGRPRPAGPLPGPDRLSSPSRPTSRATRTSRRTCGSRPTAPDGHDFGAHGAFDDRAKPRSSQQWLAHRYRLLAGTAAAAAVGAAFVRGLRRRR